MKTATILLATFLTFGLKAQITFGPKKSKQRVVAIETNGTMKIDGILNEKAWDSVEPLTNFIQIEPNQGLPSQNSTYLKVIYDKNNLYLGVFCADSQGAKGIRVPDLTRDFSFRTNDTFAIGIDGFLDERNSMTLATNPYGAQKDYLSFDDVYFDSDWNGLWKVRTQITDIGWYVEFEIPWKTLRYPKVSDGTQDLGVNFVRQHRRLNEISAWSPYPRSFGFNRSEYFGILNDVELPRNRTNLQVNPFTLISYEERKTNGDLSKVDRKHKIGGELKWAINSNTLLDVTFNTDFAQADADQQVNNISRFSVFFPEKRSFFLENASLFGSGLLNDGISGNMIIAPFFSRNIGLDGEGGQIPIDFGLRLVNQSPQKNYGLMAIREGNSAEMDGRYNLVGRYSKNFGKQNRVGGIFTSRTNVANTNAVGGLDGFFRLDNVQSLGAMFLSSYDTDTEHGGFAGYLQYQLKMNGVEAWWTQSYVDNKFNPALGFLSRRNVIATSVGTQADYRGQRLPLKSHLRSYKPGVKINWYHNATNGRLMEREFVFSPIRLETHQGDFFDVALKSQYQRISETFRLLDREINPGEYKYSRFVVIGGTDPSKKVSTSMSYEGGNFFNGTLNTLNASLLFIPIPQINLKSSFLRNEFKNFGMNRASDKVDLLTMESRLFLNPRISLFGMYQHNTLNNLDAYNIRLALEYKPLSYFYLVFNSNNFQNGLESFEQKQAIIKISFLKQF